VDTIQIPDIAVSWNSFTANRVGLDGELDWTTSNEIQVSSYEVERSGDGATYSLLTSITPSSGSTGTHQYTDANVAASFTGTVYYRIKQVNANGSSFYSPVDTIQIPDIAVIWNSFTASLSGIDGQLDWSTSNEVQLASYEVERSVDGTNYSSLTTVSPSGGNSGTYQYTDPSIANTFSGTLYYRIKQVNGNGSVFYSPVDSIQIPDIAVVWNSFTASIVGLNGLLI